MSESSNGHVPFMLGKRAPLPVHSCDADRHQLVRDHGCKQLQTVNSLHTQLSRQLVVSVVKVGWHREPVPAPSCASRILPWSAQPRAFGVITLAWALQRPTRKLLYAAITESRFPRRCALRRSEADARPSNPSRKIARAIGERPGGRGYRTFASLCPGELLAHEG